MYKVKASERKIFSHPLDQLPVVIASRHSNSLSRLTFAAPYFADLSRVVPFKIAKMLHY